jgi:predicted nucleotidyltransferase
MKPEFALPTQQDIVQVLTRHPLVKLREKVLRAFVVGSFAKGAQNEESDVDVLLEVAARAGETSAELEDHYRRLLRAHFVKHDIRGKDDSVHPQWCGRRVDLYITYDADLESRPKVALAAKPAPTSSRQQRP